MTPTFYDTPERQAQLIAEARTWLHTPFRTNGSAKGKACDCHNLVYALHCATGAWGPFPIPRGQSGIAGMLQVRRMSSFFHTRPECREVELPDESFGILRLVESLQPGDILTGETIGGEYHLATFLGTVDGQLGAIVSTTHRSGVAFFNLLDPSWSRPIVTTFRILPHDVR
ncbi:MAG: hypothetical protein Q7P63_01085 [Verrucomicrobiota bacterium JB022]|nr:hypothetical protein [Verrucomicrobiota bacterium JB022]